LEKWKELYLKDKKSIVDEAKLQRFELKLSILCKGFVEFKEDLKNLDSQVN